ncbi:MAG TPA: endolytic transglycosylase MltG [Flavobacteriaceae bacterium]|nr:endolytic transglycosylase MltG [Flavobacteriaceae bacterium]MCB9214143.1 endolytic transglycosylase MltG [Alteromonas sp.]HPF11954.1 endolytic transglycosylase MltG [Flavobacteriaceae bacterium]HQU22057.1 endolytic transglycosylase MltG [Flavobacteriaceae bacterium]HQU65414.1 endolytic transglycosylase MltG [Flavobacteriaceae bacterium]
MSNLKKVILATLILGLVLMGGFAYYVYRTLFLDNTAFLNTEAHLYIATGSNFQQVLEDIGPLLKNEESFIALAKRKGYIGNVKSGHFLLKKGMNNNDIINTIRSKNSPILVKFNNQERLEDLAGQLAGQIEPDSLSILNALKDSAFLTQNAFTTQNALGMYLPNTYEVYWNTSATNFRDKMLKEYQRFWNETRKAKAKQIGLSETQVISLAAIVQKETAKVEERARVAGVYLNRIKAGMYLQADPTVIYAKKLVEDDFEQTIKRVLYKDLEIDSPYNTYKYAGVPPGPIAMPDISSIDAVLNAEQHDYYYFVADVNRFGYHKFAKTLAQHNANKAEYVRWISGQGVQR